MLLAVKRWLDDCARGDSDDPPSGGGCVGWWGGEVGGVRRTLAPSNVVYQVVLRLLSQSIRPILHIADLDNIMVVGASGGG